MGMGSLPVSSLSFHLLLLHLGFLESILCIWADLLFTECMSSLYMYVMALLLMKIAWHVLIQRVKERERYYHARSSLYIYLCLVFPLN